MLHLAHFVLQSFDPFDEDLSSMLVMASAIFEVTGCISNCRLSRGKLRSFLHAARQCYRPLPYHNFYHGFHVLLNCYRLLRSAIPLIRFSPLELTALFTSAISHDLDHPGVSNSMLVRSDAPLSAWFNGQAVNENLSVARALYLLKSPECSFLEDLDLEAQKEVLRLFSLRALIMI